MQNRLPTVITPGLASTAVPHGEDEEDRIMAQHRARLQMADAQALWEAAATEEGWAHYREGAKPAQHP